MKLLSLRYANKKMRQGQYEDALFIYEEINQREPYIYPIIKFNIDYCKYKVGKNKQFLSNSSESFGEEGAETATLRNFGEALLGPLILMFFQRLEKANFDGAKKIFFFGREGFFLTKAYDELIKKRKGTSLEAVYLNISRRFLFKLCLCRSEMVSMSLERSYTGSVEDFLEDRYGFSAQEVEILSPIFHRCGVFSLALPVDAKMIEGIIFENRAIFEKIVLPKYLAYKDYLRNQGLFDTNTVNCLDLGYSGTTQKILGRLFEFSTIGHYFFTTENAVDTEKEKYIGYILHRDKISSGNALIERSSYVEAVLTAPVGTLLDIKRNENSIEFVYDKKMRPQIYFDAIENMAEGAIEYAVKNFDYKNPMDYAELHNYYTNFVNSRNNFPQRVQDILEMDDAISGIDNLNPVKYFLG